MKLWLDDIRTPPNKSWTWVKTVGEAIDMIKNEIVTEASLDHDLGPGQLSGYDFVKWLEEHEAWPEKILVHSQNPVGKQNMLRAIVRHFERDAERE